MEKYDFPMPGLPSIIHGSVLPNNTLVRSLYGLRTYMELYFLMSQGGDSLNFNSSFLLTFAASKAFRNEVAKIK